jgi:hypothetical protein
MRTTSTPLTALQIARQNFRLSLVLALTLLLAGGEVFAQSGSGQPGDPPENVLRLRADEGVTGTSEVTEWEDQSGFGNDADATALPGPAFTGSLPGLNGQAALTFDRANDEGIGPSDTDDINTRDAGYDARTFTLVFESGADTAPRQVIYEEGGPVNGFNVYVENGDLIASAWSDDWTADTNFEISTPVSANTAYIATFTFDADASAPLELFVNGASVGTVADGSITTMPSHAGDIAIGNVIEDTQFDDTDEVDGDGGNGFSGQVAEVFVSNQVITSAQRQIRESALSERYDIAIDPAAFSDRYGFATYIADIAGIGRAADGTEQLRDASSVLSFQNPTLGNDEFALVGANADPLRFEPESDPSGIGTRLERVWRYDESGTPGFDIAFDISTFPALASGQSYRLLVEDDDAGGDGTFTGPATTVVDGTLNGSTFVVSDLSALGDGDYVTLARTDVDGPSGLTYDGSPLTAPVSTLPVTTNPTVSGGTAPYTFSIKAGTDPGDTQSVSFGSTSSDDVQIDPNTGEVTVTSSAPSGAYQATVTVTDAAGKSSVFPDVIAITVQEPVQVSYDPASQTVIADGSTIDPIQTAAPTGFSVEDASVSYSLIGGDDLSSAGLSFDTGTGEISGVPSRTGLIRAEVLAVGSGAAIGEDTVEVNVAVVGGDGPGGVGDDNSVIARLAATSISAVDGDAVDIWGDDSNYGNDAESCNALSGENCSIPAPAYTGSVPGLNDRPALTFSGNEALSIADNPQFNEGGEPYVQRSQTVVFRTGDDVTSRQVIVEEGGGTRGFNVYLNGGDLYVGAWNLNDDDEDSTPWGEHFLSTESNAGDGGSGTVTVSPNTAYLVTLTYDAADAVLEAHVNGTLIGRVAGPANVGRFFDHNEFVLGAQRDGSIYDDIGGDAREQGNFFTGRIAEFVAYGVDLTNAQRQLVESALGAKYGIDVATPRFDFAGGAEAASGTAVAGVGQTNGRAHDPRVQSSRVALDASSVGMDGTFYTVGHDGGRDLFIRDTDIPSAPADGNGSDSDAVESRLERVWRVDLNGGSVGFDIDVDVSSLSLGTDQEFVLVVDDDPDIRDSQGDAAQVLRPSSTGPDSRRWRAAALSGLSDGDFVTLARTVGEEAGPSDLTYTPAPLVVTNGSPSAEATATFDGGRPQPTFSITEVRDESGTVLSPAPSEISVDANSGTVTVDGSTGLQGVFEVEVRAENASGGTSTDLTVRIVEPITDFAYADTVQTVSFGRSVAPVTPTLTPDVSSITDGGVAYSLTRVSVNGTVQSDLGGTGLSFDAGTGEISGSPGQRGTVSITVRAEGTGGASGTRTANVKVTALGDRGVAGLGGSTTTLLDLRTEDVVAASGDPIDEWTDRSGFANDATQSGSPRPILQTGSDGLNEQNVLQFDGMDDVLAVDDAASLNTGGEPYLQRSLTMVFRTGSDVSSRQVLYEEGGGARGLNLYLFNGSLTVAGWNEEDDPFPNGDPDPTTPWEDGEDDQFVSVSEPVSANTAYVATLVFDGITGTIELHLNGADIGANDGAGRLHDHGGDIGIGAVRNQTKFENGDEPNDGLNYAGDIADIVFHDASLNAAQRIVLHNALSAKFGIGTGTPVAVTNDRYAGDEPANGDRDLGVFGIGRESATDLHASAGFDGLHVAAAAGLDDGDYLLAGHRTPVNAVRTDDIDGVGGLEARMDRVWYVDRTEPSTSDLSVEVISDLSHAGFQTIAGDPSNYVLLERACGMMSWSSVTSASSVQNSDEIRFGTVTLEDGRCYTIGTTDRDQSPLTSTAITIEGTPGAGDATTGQLGDDAGWRMIGPPVTGSTAGGLYSNTDAQLIEFGLPEGSMFFQWDDGADTWSAVSDPSTRLVNGRGYLLFLFDDEGTADADPIDPSLTIDIPGTVTTEDVTVGDNTVDGGDASDPPLDKSAEFHFLANPYNQAFDLSALGAEGGGSLGDAGFQQTIQVWDGGATTAEGNASQGSYLAPISVNGIPGESTLLGDGGDVASAWQAFFVERSSVGSGDETLTFRAEGRTDGSRRIVGSKSDDEPAPFARVGLELTVKNEGQVVSRDVAATLHFHPDAGAGWDAFDASKLQPFLSSYAVIGPVGTLKEGGTGVKAQESRPLRFDSLSVPVQLRTVGGVSGTATLSPALWQQVPDAWNLTLVDTKGTASPADDVRVDLSPADTVGYTFALSAPDRKSGGSADSTATPSAASASVRPDGRDLRLPRRLSQKAGVDSSVSRFRVDIVAGTDDALPVELAEMDATVTDRQIDLTWATTSERNNAGFHVEHRRLGPSVEADADTTQKAPWSRVGYVEGAGTTDETQSYAFTTSELEYGTHEFRLRQVDTDGSVSLSQAVEAEVTLDRAYEVTPPRPHPVQRQAAIEVTVRESQPIRVEVYDLLGRRVAVPFEQEMPGQQTREVQLDASRLASGTYFVRIRGDSFRVTERMTVVH